MIYLDTSALIKLYLLEDGSDRVDSVVMSQDNPLPIWELQEAELNNAFRLKVFRKELSEKEADHLSAIFQERKRGGFYATPELDRNHLLPAFIRICRHTQTLGCRTFDIMHVACAQLIGASRFISFDQRQCQLGNAVGLSVETP